MPCWRKIPPHKWTEKEREHRRREAGKEAKREKPAPERERVSVAA